ncbi:hypothetical protein [Mechercharimyces sp. CAU 1602]|uniref:hypothetical protein n=1 Tax=Mechercharimyces sp. CAU 1602 TaxID=2973933 RepID=UPI00216256C6|nr:hypothetical protein [Mechercharimyces sp. CAU 1602]
MNEIFSLADVAWVNRGNTIENEVLVILKCSRWDFEYEEWANIIVLLGDEADEFLERWVSYKERGGAEQC